jgi:metal transporter CNNM
LDKIVPPYLAILISSAAVVIFGEVIPQAYCTGPHKVTIGYYMSPFLRFLQCILYPFVKPIVYILDNWLGHHEGKITLTRENLKNILLLHNKMEYGYRPEEVEILQNILDLKTVSIDLVMIPLEKVFMLEANSKVNESLVDDLIKCNFSKVPIYEGHRDKVIGYIKVKNLMEFNMKEEKSLEQGEVITKVVEIHHKLNLLDAIDILKNNRINFAVILDDSNKCKGIVTLKQIFEKIVLKEFDDNDKRVLIEWGGSGPKVQNLMESK